MPHTTQDTLAELCEQVMAEGRALGISPDKLLAITAEAFALLQGSPPPSADCHPRARERIWIER